jgi:hypothetical protein
MSEAAFGYVFVAALVFVIAWLVSRKPLPAYTDASLIGLTKDEMRVRFAKPKSIGYPHSTWYPNNDSREEGGLLFRYDQELNVLSVYFAYPDHDYVAPEPLAIDLKSWHAQSLHTKRRMNADLVARSEREELPAELRTIHDVERLFPNTQFSDCWNYPSKLFESTAVLFDRNGKVCETRMEHF